jgi:hypothetical protein
MCVHCGIGQQTGAVAVASQREPGFILHFRLNNPPWYRACCFSMKCFGWSSDKSRRQIKPTFASNSVRAIEDGALGLHELA